MNCIAALEKRIEFHQRELDELIRDGGPRIAIEEVRKNLYLLQMHLDYKRKGLMMESYCLQNPDDVVCRLYDV